MDNDQIFTAEPQSRGGCGRIVTAGLGCGCLTTMALCCGVLGLGVYTFATMASDDPVRIVEVRRGIAELEIPEEFTPSASFDLVLPIVDRRVATWVLYEGRDEHSALILAELGPDVSANADLDQLIEKLDEFLAQGGADRDDVEVEESERLQLLIRDEQAEFVLARGKPEQRDDDRQYWLVTGKFRGRDGPAVLLMIVDAETLDRQQIVEMIESIR